jgi:hypothetical protein
MFAHVFRLVSYLEVFRLKLRMHFHCPHACCMHNNFVHSPVIILTLLGDAPEIRRSPLFIFLDASAAASSPSRYNPHLIKGGVSTKFQDIKWSSDIAYCLRQVTDGPSLRWFLARQWNRLSVGTRNFFTVRSFRYCPPLLCLFNQQTFSRVLSNIDTGYQRRRSKAGGRHMHTEIRRSQTEN